MLRSAVGIEFSEDDLLKIGQRTVVLERCINLREDPNRKDMLPWRMMNRSISEGPKKGEVISEKEIKELLRRYYELQGYDPETGNPTRNLLHSLGLLNDIFGLEKTLNS
jgi:aldehyde:ferredoxin oxidoreductase